MFGHVQLCPPDVVFGLNAEYHADTSPDKVNLGIGAYRTNEGKPYVLPVVTKVEEMMAADRTLNHEYLPIEGLQALSEGATKLILGEESPAITQNRVCAIQGLSGTGTGRLAFEFAQRHHSVKVAYVSKPTWGNHKGMLKHAGYEDVREYRYYNPATKGLDIEGMLKDLNDAPEGALVVLHGCAHNPSGVDPSHEEWKKIADVCQTKKLFTILDVAYQGFVSGDPDVDAWAVRYFVEKGMEVVIFQSFAKNFGLYNERCGNLAFVCADSTIAMNVKSQLKAIVRPWYSNPPNHGARIVATVLNNNALLNEWKEQLKAMANRITTVRQSLYEALKLLETPGDWSHIINQKGMFTFTGLNPTQVLALKEKHHIYMLGNGRISMCGINSSNLDHVAKSICAVVKNESKM